MTRLTIWETPENRKEYADTPCEYVYGQSPLYTWSVCGVKLREHNFPGYAGHDWCIYREAPAEIEQLQPRANDSFCCLRSGSHCPIHCPNPITDPDTAAPTLAVEPATGDVIAPQPDTAPEGIGAAPHPTDAGVEREQAARLRTSTIRYLSQATTNEIRDALYACHGSTVPCQHHKGLRLCLSVDCGTPLVHFHNEAIV